MDAKSIPFSILSEDIISNGIDDLIVRGIKLIRAKGQRINVSAGSAVQAYGVNYFLLNSRNRLHHLRDPVSIRYFCKELLAYFKGSLNVEDGLAQASSFWRKIADEDCRINSNYGYYVFYERCPNGLTQYDWVIKKLIETKDTRKAIVNINQPKHKTETKDFPCTVSMQYFIRSNKNGNNFLCSEVFARSIDVITGLPYDLGFFSFITELVYADLSERKTYPNLKLGYTALKTNFTQIYDRTSHLADLVLKNAKKKSQGPKMPKITDARKTIDDILNDTRNSDVVKWIYEKSI